MLIRRQHAKDSEPLKCQLFDQAMNVSSHKAPTDKNRFLIRHSTEGTRICLRRLPSATRFIINFHVIIRFSFQREKKNRSMPFNKLCWHHCQSFFVASSEQITSRTFSSMFAFSVCDGFHSLTSRKSDRLTVSMLCIHSEDKSRPADCVVSLGRVQSAHKNPSRTAKRYFSRRIICARRLADVLGLLGRINFITST